MALDFPSSPVDGQVFGAYIYNAAKTAWQAKEDSATVAVVSPTVPSTGNNGDIWYNSNLGIAYVYYDDGNTGQWVELISSPPEDPTKANLSGATFTGNVTAPQFISNITTGASPLQVASTTSVTNLNADLLDGNHASAFSLASHTHENSMTIALGDETSPITVGNGKVTFRAPFALTLTKIPRISLSNASTSGNPTVDIKKNGVSMFSTLLSIDANEKTSVTAATTAVLSTTAVADDDELRFDVTTSGTNAQGLKVTLYYRIV